MNPAATEGPVVKHIHVVVIAVNREECDMLVALALGGDEGALRSLAATATTLSNPVEVVDPCLDCLALVATQKGATQALAQDLMVEVLDQVDFIHAEVSRILLQQEDVDKAVEQAKQAIAATLPSFRRESNFRLWARRIARNTAVRALRPTA